MNNPATIDMPVLGWLVMMILLVGFALSAQRANAVETESAGGQLDYHFDGTISRKVLENYLDRSVTMLNPDGKLVNHWGRSSVPDVTRIETQLWFFYLAGSYINLGCEALHLGQVRLIGMADPDLKEWSGLLARIRAYARKHARRHLVLLDAHVPTGGMIVDGVSLLDFNSFPMRIKEIPEKPHEGVLEVNHLDAGARVGSRVERSYEDIPCICLRLFV